MTRPTVAQRRYAVRRIEEIYEAKANGKLNTKRQAAIDTIWLADAESLAKVIKRFKAA